MSCTDAVSWRRWASKIQIPTASRSGREREKECTESKNAHIRAHTKSQNHKRTQVSSAGRVSVVLALFLSILTLSSVLSFLLSSLQETYEAKRKEFLGDLQRKEEEMRQMFVNKVKETEAELKEKEREVSLKCVVMVIDATYLILNGL